jgi:uncharacterized OB-fold protein
MPSRGGAGISDNEVIASFPDVLVDHDNKEHFRGLLERRLLINRCQKCGYWIYPHRPMCPKCWSWDVAPTEVSGQGTIYMFTTSLPTHTGSRVSGFDYASPTPIAAVELPQRAGLRYLAEVINCKRDRLRIGLSVEITWVDRHGIPSPAFQPADPQDREA